MATERLKKREKPQGDYVLDDLKHQPADAGHDTIGGNARQQLKAYLARIERLEEDKKAVMDDMKEVYAEAKSMGFDTKILRKVVSLRKIDRREREEAQALLETYLDAVEA